VVENPVFFYVRKLYFSYSVHCKETIGMQLYIVRHIFIPEDGKRRLDIRIGDPKN